MKPPVLISAAILVSLAAFGVYFYVRSPADIEPMGGELTTVVYILLATAIVTLIAAVIGLIQKIIDTRPSQRTER